MNVEDYNPAIQIFNNDPRERIEKWRARIQMQPDSTFGLLVQVGNLFWLVGEFPSTLI
jgi:hypothetical protein